MLVLNKNQSTKNINKVKSINYKRVNNNNTRKNLQYSSSYKNQLSFKYNLIK